MVSPIWRSPLAVIIRPIGIAPEPASSCGVFAFQNETSDDLLESAFESAPLHKPGYRRWASLRQEGPKPWDRGEATARLFDLVP
jgi:hypothetical protein